MKSHVPLMGKKYVTIPMSHSWERITSFAPWVTHGIELRAFIVRKMPKSMHNMWPYIGRIMSFPINYQINLIYILSGVTRGVPCYYFTSNVKIPHLTYCRCLIVVNRTITTVLLICQINQCPLFLQSVN